jgi:hypothetical protein
MLILHLQKRDFQKKVAQILVDKHIHQQEFTVVSLDESFFFYDSLVRMVWIEQDKRPIVRVTGSHKHSCIFGAVNIEGKQLFRQYDIFNGDTFLEFLKKIHHKFPKCYLFMDRHRHTTNQRR